MPWPHSFSAEDANKKPLEGFQRLCVAYCPPPCAGITQFRFVRSVAGQPPSQPGFPELPSRNCAPLYSAVARCVNRKIQSVRQPVHAQGEALSHCSVAVTLALCL